MRPSLYTTLALYPFLVENHHKRGRDRTAFLTSEQAKDAYWRYITVSFPMRDPSLHARFAALARNEKLSTAS